MMKLKDYAKFINNLVVEHGEKSVVYSSDDEGNSYHHIQFAPSVVTVQLGYSDRKRSVVVCLN